MTSLSGEVAAMLAILGQGPGAGQVREFVDSFEVDVEEDRDDDGADEELYLVLADAGVELSFTGGELTAIFVFLDGDDEHERYRTPDALVDGLSIDGGRDEVRTAFGAPVRSREGYDLFAVDERFLHVEYLDGRPRLLTVMLRDVAA